jgi:hypothetical protein
MARRKAKADADTDADPDKLVRQKAGTYRTADDRFGVQEADTGWFLVDSAETNEFGQPLIQGPFATLKAISEALPGARKTTALPRRTAATGGRTPAKADRATRQPSKSSKAPKPSPPPPPPPSWIDKLTPAEAREVRSLIGALERDGVVAPEKLVRRDREGLLPAVAAQLIERRLDALVEDLPADERDRARRLVARAAEVLTADGTTLRAPLPRWTLVEIGADGEPPNRRIVIRPRR